MKKQFRAVPFLLILIILFTACQERKISPIKGSLKCYVDESLLNLVTVERDSFVARYPGSKIELVSAKAREGIAAVLNKEADIFISSRNLNDEERIFFDKSESTMRGFKFCYDAVVPIVNEKDLKDQITLDEIKDLLSGKTRNYALFVPEHNSGVYEYLKEKFKELKELKNISIVKSEEEAIQKIKQKNRSISFVGINTLQNVKGIKTLDVGVVRSKDDILYFKPYVAYLIGQTYPLTRTTTIFINEIGIGLASGFSTFLTSYEGQKIVSNYNLGPATVPVKMVELNRR
jgi:phosphate transport system substrate-binding protein